MFGCCNLGDGLGLGAKAGQVLRPSMFAGQDHLEGHVAFEADLPGLIHDPHAAMAQHGTDLETRNRRQLRAGRRPRFVSDGLGLPRRACVGSSRVFSTGFSALVDSP